MNESKIEVRYEKVWTLGRGKNVIEFNFDSDSSSEEGLIPGYHLNDDVEVENGFYRFESKLAGNDKILKTEQGEYIVSRRSAYVLAFLGVFSDEICGVYLDADISDHLNGDMNGFTSQTDISQYKANDLGAAAFRVETAIGELRKTHNLHLSVLPDEEDGLWECKWYLVKKGENYRLVSKVISDVDIEYLKYLAVEELLRPKNLYTAGHQEWEEVNLNRNLDKNRYLAEKAIQEKINERLKKSKSRGNRNFDFEDDIYVLSKISAGCFSNSNQFLDFLKQENLPIKSYWFYYCLGYLKEEVDISKMSNGYGSLLRSEVFYWDRYLSSNIQEMSKLNSLQWDDENLTYIKNEYKTIIRKGQNEVDGMVEYDYDKDIDAMYFEHLGSFNLTGFEGQSSYCEACQESPCMCSDPF